MPVSTTGACQRWKKRCRSWSRKCTVSFISIRYLTVSSGGLERLIKKAQGVYGVSPSTVTIASTSPLAAAPPCVPCVRDNRFFDPLSFLILFYYPRSGSKIFLKIVRSVAFRRKALEIKKIYEYLKKHLQYQRPMPEGITTNIIFSAASTLPRSNNTPSPQRSWVCSSA